MTRAGRASQLKTWMMAVWESLSLNARGAIMVSIGGLTLVIMSSMVKTVGQSLHSFEIVFFRCLIGFLLVLPILMRRGSLASARTGRFGLHLVRSLFGMSAMFCGFYAFTNMPLADATALLFSRPLFMIVLAAVLLGEAVGWRRGLATMIGFTGILIMTRPFGEGFEPVALVAAAGALLAGCVVVCIKKLSRTEPVITIMFYYTFWTTVLSAIPAALVWQTPTMHETFLLLAIGILGVLGQTAMTHGFKMGEASFVVPLDYLRLVYATLFGLALFGEIPTLISVIGALTIVASSLYILRRGGGGGGG